MFQILPPQSGCARAGAPLHPPLFTVIAFNFAVSIVVAKIPIGVADFSKGLHQKLNQITVKRGGSWRAQARAHPD